MRISHILGSSILLFILSSFMWTPKSGQLEIGEKATQTELNMMATDGQNYTLNGLAKENGTLVVFSCNTCPFVVGSEGRGMEGWQGRYNDLQAWCDANQVGMVLVNSNEAKRNNGDNLDDMIEQVASQGFTSTYVVDQNHQLADAFGAITTPHAYLFDSEWTLVYRGAIDDNYEKAADVNETYVKTAVKWLAKGKVKKIRTNTTKAVGCSIKRIQKQ